jgi:histidinol-phosphatase (PHP family)
MTTPLLYESHCHTPLCKHAFGHPREYAATALARGFKGITFTCHCPLPNGFSANVRMAPHEFDDYVAMIEETRNAFAGKLDVRIGLESDYYPGVESWLERLHARVPLSHVLGSIHYQIPDYRELYYTGNPQTYQEVYFDHLARSAESGLFDTLAHPDLIKNDSPKDWDFERIRPVIKRSLDRIAVTGVAMELNTSGIEKSLPEMNPSPSMLAMMLERNIPVVIGADAHVPERVGDGYLTAMETLTKVGYQEISYFIDRKRHTLAISDAMKSIK